MNYIVYSDGAARGNPGSAGAGFVVYDEGGKLVHSAAIPLGNTTNNVAEYTAILKAAEYVQGLNPGKVDFLLDSELIVKQVAGIYKVKTEHLIPLYSKLMVILAGLNATCKHVPRAQNKVADKLANEGADGNK
jgi:ribonuclease HI